MKALYWTALLLGLREGELCGLRLEDVNLSAGTLSPTYGVQRQQGKLRHDVRLKTEESRQSLPIPAVLQAIIKDHIEWLKEAQAFYKWQEHGLLFPSERGTPLEPRNLVRHFKSVLARAGLPDIPFHNLRHTCATLLLQFGERPRIVQEILRHSSFYTTMAYYAHAMPEAQRAAVEGLGTLIAAPERVLELPPTKTPTRA